jgi:hypothetical protein
MLAARVATALGSLLIRYLLLSSANTLLDDLHETRLFVPKLRLQWPIINHAHFDKTYTFSE